MAEHHVGSARSADPSIANLRRPDWKMRDWRYAYCRLQTDGVWSHDSFIPHGLYVNGEQAKKAREIVASQREAAAGDEDGRP